MLRAENSSLESARSRPKEFGQRRRSQRRIKEGELGDIEILCRPRNDKERENIRKERAFNNAKFYIETSKSSFESETGTLSSILKYEASVNDENGRQVIKVKIWRIRKQRH